MKYWCFDSFILAIEDSLWDQLGLTIWWLIFQPQQVSGPSTAPWLFQYEARLISLLLHGTVHSLHAGLGRCQPEEHGAGGAGAWCLRVIVMVQICRWWCRDEYRITLPWNHWLSYGIVCHPEVAGWRGGTQVGCLWRMISNFQILPQCRSGALCVLTYWKHLVLASAHECHSLKVTCVSGASLFYDAKDPLQNGTVVLVFRGIKGHRKVWSVLFWISTWIYVDLFDAGNMEVPPSSPPSFFQGFICQACTLPLSYSISLIWGDILCSNGSRTLTFLLMMNRQCWSQGKYFCSGLDLDAYVCAHSSCFAVFSNILWDWSLSVS